MTELILGPLLRHVTETTATFWVETDAPCTVAVLGHEAHTFHVAGHHYALVVVRDLRAGQCCEYDVRLDGTVRWPDPALGLPPSSVRTVRAGESTGQPLRILFGSCRTAAPHEPPWTLELALDPAGRGIDAYHAHARRLAGTPVERWPDLMLWLGDQVYADDSSPAARARIAGRREQTPAPPGLPPSLVYDFEEYTWLYHESWSSPWERWLLSVVPSVMIFDDHEMIDDWNISDTWVHDIREQTWWQAHVLGGLMTYWIYQHLGNLSPDDIDAEGILAALGEADDGEPILREWAMRSEEFNPVPGGYRFSIARRLGPVQLVVIDSRNSRVLAPGARSILDEREWAWVRAQCDVDADHLVIGSSLPIYVPEGMHDLQRCSEAVIDGAWGRRPFAIQQRSVEWLRRALDMEDWPAFGRSFDDLNELLVDVASRSDPRPPASITVLSGDIHFSYHSRIHFPPGDGVRAQVHQIVNSPIRNALRPAEKAGMRVAMSASTTLIGRALRRLAGLPRTAARWRIDHGPVWDNAIGELSMIGREARVVVEHAKPDDDGNPTLTVAFTTTLTDAAPPVWGTDPRGIRPAGRIRAIVDRSPFSRRARPATTADARTDHRRPDRPVRA